MKELARRAAAAVRREWIAALELFVLPCVPALLPWRLGFAWLRLCARMRWPYRRECDASYAVARHFVPIADEQEWKRLHRLYRLVDHADCWLVLLRGAGWARRHVREEAPWPPLEGPFVGAFFHWSAGLWPVFLLRERGTRAAVLAGRFSARTLGSRVAAVYGRIRLSVLARSGGRPLIYAPGSVAQAREHLAQGHAVVGTPDVPPQQTRHAAEVRLFGRRALVPEGVRIIAQAAGVPVVIFSSAMDAATGKRRIAASPPLRADDPQLMQAIAAEWENLLRRDSWAYGLWYVFPAFFLDATTDGDAPSTPTATPA